MDAGLVSSLSGALAQSKRVDLIANNLANADTPAFKGNDLSFEESLQGAHHEDLRNDIPTRPYKDSELLSEAGKERRAVLYGAEYTDLRAGSYRQTSNPLDIAIQGNGFLEVLTPQGIRLTRAGNLALDAGGRLTTQDGFLVLGPGAANTNPAPAAGPAPAGLATASLDPAQNAAVPATPASPTAPIAGLDAAAMRAITVGSGRVQIDREGNIYSNNAQGNLPVGRLSLVQVANPEGLKKEGRNLFVAGPDVIVRPVGTAAPAERNPAQQAALAEAVPKENPLGPLGVAPQIHQGVLEASNVNPVLEMTKLIEAHRLFDQNTKMMQTIGDANSRVAEVGKF